MATAKTETEIAIEINGITGEQTVRPLTAEEIAFRAEVSAQFAAEQAAIEAKAAARQSALAKLAELGLTEEEIAAL